MGSASTGSQKIAADRAFLEEQAMACRQRLQRFGIIKPDEMIPLAYYLIWANRQSRDFPEAVLRESQGEIVQVYLSRQVNYRWRNSIRRQKPGKLLQFTVGEFDTKILAVLGLEARSPLRYPHPLVVSHVPFGETDPEKIIATPVYIAMVNFLRAEAAVENEDGESTGLKSLLSGVSPAARRAAERDADNLLPVPAVTPDGIIDLPSPESVTKARGK